MTAERFGARHPEQTLTPEGARTVAVLRAWAVLLTVNATLIGWTVGAGLGLSRTLAPLLVQVVIAWGAGRAVIGKRIR